MWCFLNGQHASQQSSRLSILNILKSLEDDINNVDDDMDDSPCQNLNDLSEDWFDISATGMKELQDMIVRCLSN